MSCGRWKNFGGSAQSFAAVLAHDAEDEVAERRSGVGWIGGGGGNDCDSFGADMAGRFLASDSARRNHRQLQRSPAPSSNPLGLQRALIKE